MNATTTTRAQVRVGPVDRDPPEADYTCKRAIENGRRLVQRAKDDERILTVDEDDAIKARWGKPLPCIDELKDMDNAALAGWPVRMPERSGLYDNDALDRFRARAQELQREANRARQPSFLARLRALFGGLAR